jgi:hypothetical protein
LTETLSVTVRVVFHLTTTRGESFESVPTIDVVCWGIEACSQKQGKTISLTEIFHQQAHQLMCRSLAPILRDRENVAKVSDAPMGGCEHIGEGLTIAMEQIVAGIDTEILAGTTPILPAPTLAFVSEECLDTRRPLGVRAIDDTCLDTLTTLESYLTERLIHALVHFALWRTDWRSMFS